MKLTYDQKAWLAAFSYGAGLTLLLFLLSGCALTRALRHPFTPPATIQEALPAQPPAPAFSILHPFTTTAAPPQSAQAVPVKLASGETVLMMPVSTPAFAPKATPLKTPVAKAIDYLLWLIWIGGLLAIAAGVACIVWLGQLWLGVKLIACSVGAIILGTWFAFHYIAVITVCLIAGVAWIVLDHFVTWAAVQSWADKQAATIKKNL